MKKMVLFLILISLSVVSAHAAQNRTGSGGNGQGPQQNLQPPTSTIPTGNQIRNQNQVQTENQGEERQLQIQTQEQEQVRATQGGSVNSQNRNQNAREHMSVVAERVQELLQIQGSGGIGEQIRQVAQEQSDAQDVIQYNTEKLNSRGALKKFIMGTDYVAIKNLKTQLTANQLRITQLEELKTQLIDTPDGATIQSTIDALIQQNSALSNQIESEEKVQSMFGWVFRFFSR